MSSQYANPTGREMHDFLLAVGLDRDAPSTYGPTKERTYSRQLNADTQVVVYTTIRHDGRTRRKGSDAIRAILWSNEFGFIKGEVFFVGSDALPPTETKQFYSFPAKISLEKQNLTIRGKDVTLQSGMSVSANIKIRKRRVINIFLDNLLGPIEKMKEVR